MSEVFDRYVNGWIDGDLDAILAACADDFIFDDAIDGRYTKAEFPAYFESLGEGEVSVTHVVTSETGGLETAWCWWRIDRPVGVSPGTQAGASLAEVGQDGVRWQKITYFEWEQKAAPRD